jgi:MDMPI C-terminal domain
LPLTEGETPRARTGHERGDAAVRGTASDLLLFVWRRKQPSDFEILGDEALVASLWKYFGPGE